MTLLRALPFASALALALASPALPVRAANAEAQAGLADSVREQVIAWRRDFHRHPELGNRETRTAGIVAAHLRALGLEVKTGVAHTGVVAFLRTGRPGPRLALRADMDALPVKEETGLPFASQATAVFRGESVGVMHACGHDAHTAILMGVAQLLVQQKDQLAGEVMFIFQPAEEGPPDGETGGAEQMLAEGLFRDFKPDAVLGLHVFSTHNVGQIGYRSGPLMAASDRFRIVVRGKQGHGAKPWEGIDPIVAAANLITATQTIVSRRQNIARQPVVITFGAIKGGIRYNIIPDSVELIGTVRTFDAGMREQVFAQMRELAGHVAAAHGATVEAEIPDTSGNPVTVNDPALTARLLPVLRGVVGADNLIERPLEMGAEDFSFYAREVPGFFFIVGGTPRGQDPAKAPSNHSPNFFLDEEALSVGTRAMHAAALEMLETRE